MENAELIAVFIHPYRYILNKPTTKQKCGHKTLSFHTFFCSQRIPAPKFPPYLNFYPTQIAFLPQSDLDETPYPHLPLQVLNNG